MHVEAFTSHHYEALKDVLDARQVPGASTPLPSLGWVAYERGELIAYVGLRQIEGNLALVDGLVSNVDADAGLRHSALDKVLESLTQYSDASGIKSILAWTSDAHTLTRSERHGFMCLPKTLVYRTQKVM